MSSTLFHFSPRFVIQSYKTKFPDASLEVTKFRVHDLVRTMLLVNEKYSVETVENTLHYLINRQVIEHKTHIDDAENLHTYIKTNIHEIYEDQNQTSLCSLCSSCLEVF